MNIQKLTLFGALVLLIACGSGVEERDILGYKCVLHSDGTTQKPAHGEYVYFDYILTNDKGEELESTITKGEPTQFRIPPEASYYQKAPMIELLKLLSVGDSATLYFPVDSLPNSASRYPGTQNVVYNVVLRDIKSEAEFNKEAEAQRAEANKKALEAEGIEGDKARLVAETLSAYKAGDLNDKLIKTGTGLEIYVHEEGDGPKVEVNNTVVAHYYGVLKDNGSMFDNSFKRGSPFSFVNGKGQVIQGWDQGFRQLKKGSKATMFIPYQMAYGENGRPPTIPAKSDLVFYVEVEDIK